MKRPSHLSQAKRMRKAEGVLAVDLKLCDVGCKRATFGYPKTFNSNQPRRGDPVKVFLYIVGQTPAAACSVIRLFTEKHGRHFFPIDIHQVFTAGALHWLREVFMCKWLTSWERGMLQEVDLERRSISYRLSHGKHHWATALALKSTLSEHGCDLKPVMKCTWDFFGAPAPLDVIQAVSASFGKALLGIQQIRRPLPHDVKRMDMLFSILRRDLQVVAFVPIRIFRKLEYSPCRKLPLPFLTIVGPPSECRLADALLRKIMVVGTVPCSLRGLDKISAERSSMNTGSSRSSRTASMQSGELIKLKVAEIRFTQACIGDRFRNRRPLMDLITALLANPSTIKEVQPIRVVWHGGLYWSKDNRRLFAYKHCRVGVIEVRLGRELDQEFMLKYTTGSQFHYLTHCGQRVGIKQSLANCPLPRSHMICMPLSQLTSLMTEEDQLLHDERLDKLGGVHPFRTSSFSSPGEPSSSSGVLRVHAETSPAVHASSKKSRSSTVILDDAIGEDLPNSSQDASSLQEVPACIAGSSSDSAAAYQRAHAAAAEASVDTAPQDRVNMMYEKQVAWALTEGAAAVPASEVISVEDDLIEIGAIPRELDLLRPSP